MLPLCGRPSLLLELFEMFPTVHARFASARLFYSNDEAGPISVGLRSVFIDEDSFAH
jgi:hypothetical protein